MPKPKTAAIKIRIPEEMRADLDAIAAQRDTSTAKVMRDAIDEYLARHPLTLRDVPNSSAASVDPAAATVKKLASVVAHPSVSGTKYRLSPKARRPAARAARPVKAAGSLPKSDPAKS